jgi:hypothetical protein
MSTDNGKARVKRPANAPASWPNLTAAEIAATLPVDPATLADLRRILAPVTARIRERKARERGEAGDPAAGGASQEPAAPAVPQREAGETMRPSPARSRQRSSPPPDRTATADPAAPAAGLTGTMADFDTGAG